MAEQTRCPYSTEVLDGTEPENDEHILPVALGAPANFTLRAKAAMNSRMNDLVDSPAIHDPLLRLIAMGQGVESRSGAVRAKLDGVVEGSGESVQIQLAQGSADFKFRSPVVRDPETGLVTGVHGFGDDAQRLVDQIVRDNARKGRKVVAGDVEQKWPGVRASASMNLHVIRRELAKIAYLMTVRMFGDEAIVSPYGATYRAAILASTMEEFVATGIRCSTFQEFVPGFPRPGIGKHALTCVRLGGQIISAVTLFGTFNALFASPSDGFTADEATGEVVIINASTGELSSYPYLDVVLDIMQTGLPGEN